MEFVANGINGVYLRDILPKVSNDAEVNGVLAAIAYGSSFDGSDELLKHCVENKFRLDIWMRYDHTVPVKIPLLKRLLKHQKDNVFTKFVPDKFHPKVIWWKGYGAYIGSANHTNSAWNQNIEAGIFLTEDEMISNGMDLELETFFSYLSNLDKCISISPDYIKEMEDLNALNGSGINEKALKARKHDEWGGPASVKTKAAYDKRKERFRTEWLSTIGLLKSIEERLDDYTPNWIDGSIPKGWQVDQFLHAYYYNKVRDGVSQPYEKYHNINQKDPEFELRKQLKWWVQQISAPSDEDKTLFRRAPLLQKMLPKEKILSLSEQDLAEVCECTHATRDHVIKIPLAVLGRSELDILNRKERFKLFAPWLLKQRNKKNHDIRQLLHYVLYGGADDQMWDRIFNAGRNSEYAIPRYGLNSIAEVAGWVRPDISPPRNGRTSKALRALGYPVNIY